MRFRVLGPLEVEADDGPVLLGGPKERLLLALLLTRPNQVVSVEALIRGLWGERPPPTAAKTLQSHVKRLRRALEPSRSRGATGQVLITRQPGYLLRVVPGALDATRFGELTAQGRRALAAGEAEAAGSLLRQALGLWRGQAFEEFTDSDVAVAEADRLAELRLAALEDRLEADLHLGRHRELVAELEGLVRDQPLRERLWAQLMLALYRSGRQADALLAYQRARSVLVEELGIDPGAELRRLQAAILAQDPGLELPPKAATWELPQALQPVGPPFVGRSAELAWLGAAWTRAAHGRGGVVFVAGGQGMGKTRLAAEFAREVHDRSGWVLYGRCVSDPDAPLQPFRQALAGWDAAGRDMPSIQRSPTVFGKSLVDLLTGRPDATVLLVLDDLHLAKTPALEALAAFVTASATRRLMVLGAYRAEVSPKLTALVPRLDPSGVAHRRLDPFNRDEVAQVLGLYGSEQAARAAADTVLEATGGVPLLVHQAAGEWAQAHAARRVEETAGQAASSRDELRRVQARLADDVVDLQELREHTEQVTRLATGQPGEEPEDRPAVVVCPYKGLARFEPTDAGFFFGRERLVAELVTHLIGAGLLGVIGPSGSGKSSLVRAGLLPALADGVLPGSDRWRQLLVRPGEHPMRELGRVLDVGDSISTATASRANVALETAASAPVRLLLVVDQFEEVFTTCRDEAERAAFLAVLVEAAQAGERPVTVVVAVRADYYGHCAADPSLAGLLAANHVLVGPMNQDELRRAIELPARRAGLSLEPGLADAMIAEVAEEPGGLPLLSCALLESWQHRRGRTLTVAAYEQTGGVRGAVARLAERAWHQLDPDQQAVARRVLLRLAGPGEGEAVVRRRVLLAEFRQSENERVRTVLDTLTDHRLLTRSEDTVELAHEALLREWPRLRGWLEEDVQGRALHRHLIGAAQEWDHSGRDPGELYRGARLTGALDWAYEHHADLNQREREFLDAGRAEAEREVADARRRAEQETRRARQEARISRRLRAALAGLAVVLVLALVAGGLALALRGRAEHAALVADSRRLGAQALLEDELDRSLLLARQAVALDDSLETRGDLLAALLRSPAATTVLRGARLDGISALGLSPDGRLLAVGDADGTVSIFDLRTRRPIRGEFQAQSQITDLKFSPNGSLLAFCTTEPGEPVHLWDIQGVRQRHDLQAGPEEVTGVEFSADGQTLVALSTEDFGTGNGDAFLTRWDVGTGHRLKGPARVSSHGGDALIATPDGGRLVIVNAAEVLVEAAGTFRRLHRFPHGLKQPQIFVAAVSPTDGRTLALGSTEGWVEFLDLFTGRRRRAVAQHGGVVLSVRFSPDGKTLATGGDDRTVKVWNVASRQIRETFQGHEARVTALQFSPDGRTLYSGGSKSVISWDLGGSSRLGRPFSFFPGELPALAVSSDRSLIATPDVKKSDHIALRDIRSPQQIRQSLVPGVGRISAMAFSPDGKRLAVGGEHTRAPVVLNVASGAVVRKMTGGGHDDGIFSLQFDPKGQLLVTGGSGDRRAVVWDTRTGRPLLNLRHPGEGRFFQEISVGWSPDGSMVATAGGQTAGAERNATEATKGKVVIWRAASGEQLATLKVDKQWVSSVAFSPDGSTVAATGVNDRAVTLWDVATWKPVGRLPHPIFIGSVAFNSHGTTLATFAFDNKVRLWDVASMRQIGAALPGPENPAGGVPCDPCRNVAGFDASGSHLVALNQNGAALVWDVDPNRWKERACAIVARSLTQEEWEELLPGRSYQPACRQAG